MSKTPTVRVTDGQTEFFVSMCVTKNGGGTNPLQVLVDAQNPANGRVYQDVVDADASLADVVKALAAQQSGRPITGFVAQTDNPGELDAPISTWSSE